MFLINNLLSVYLTEILVFSATLLSILWLWMKYHYSYWSRQSLPNVKPSPFFGNFKEIFLMKKDPCTHFQELYYHEKEKNHPVIGLYVMNRPCLLIRNLDLIKQILIKDFHKFSNRYSSSDPHSDSIGSDNLFFAKNPMWREIRVKLTPVFTSGKIKQMFSLIEEMGRELDKYLLKLTETSKDHTTMQEVKDINALFTTDVIASVAYGVQANSFTDPNSDFRRNGKRIFTFTKRRALEFNSMFFFPSLVRFCGFKVFSKETSEFLKKTINYVMGERVKSGQTRNDLIDVLLNFKQEAKADLTRKHFILERDCLIAQAAVFFSAGFETSSGTMSFTLYEMAKHQDLQKRLRQEIFDTLNACNGKITYDHIMEMKYLDCVVKEVLRKYPPLPFLDRECTLTAEEKGYSLKPFVDYEIPNGMPIYIPMQAIHMDPEIFPDPQRFDPERFAPENKSSLNLNGYMPFGIGPHNCIGERFGILQAKVGLVNFLRNHYVTPCEKSHKEIKFDPRAIIIQPEGGIFCNIVRDPWVQGSK